MHVLGRMVEAVKPGGLMLDLQVIRPNPVVEVDGRVVCEIDGEPLFRTADAATAAIDALVRSGTLVEQAIDDHDVREHYDDGPDLIDAFADKRRQLPADALPALQVLTHACVIRERCRLRRLRVSRAMHSAMQVADVARAIGSARRTLDELLETRGYVHD